jgi:hypothetical protein
MNAEDILHMLAVIYWPEEDLDTLSARFFEILSELPVDERMRLLEEAAHFNDETAG